MMQMKNILHEEAIFLNHECYQLITHLGVFVGHKPYINQYNDVHMYILTSIIINRLLEYRYQGLLRMLNNDRFDAQRRRCESDLT